MKIIAFLSLCLLAITAEAQSDSSHPGGSITIQNFAPGGVVPGQDVQLAQLRGDIVPHSPEAEAMAKYDVLPVTLYTGMPNISIPIGEIKTPRLSISFNLSYNNNGYKPTEAATWAGLGWSVQGGGVITRLVKGQVDEFMGSGFAYDDYAAMIALITSQPFLQSATAGFYDTEPDLYIFNVCGYSGKFIMIKDKAYLFPQQNIKISRHGDGFELVDDKGNSYLFDEYETTYQKQGSGTLNITTHKSAWYLSTISSADKKDVIEFNYLAYSYKQPATFVDSYTISSTCTGNNTDCHSYQSLAFDGDHINSRILLSVVSDYGRITFGASTADRQDLIGSVGAKILDDIKVLGPLGSSYYKKFTLNHSYFGDHAKLKLDKVVLTTTVTSGEDDTHTTVTPVNEYRFDYESDGVFPVERTRGIDLYGYYNGAGNAMLFPAGYFSPSLQPYGDRSPHIQSTKLGTLKKMTYPTGGYSTFEWEPNRKGHFYVTSDYQNATVQATNIYSMNTPFNGVTHVSKVFTLTTEQDVSMNLGYFEDGAAPTIPIVRIYNSDDQLVYSSPPLPSGANFSTVTAHLLPATYTLYVDCQQASNQTSCNLAYKNYVIDNTLGDGPGLRIRKIAFFDNLHGTGDPSLVKEYRYNEGEDLLSTGLSVNNMEIRTNCTPVGCAQNYSQTTMQMSVKSALSDLADASFYYKKVTEINRDVEHGGKTEYEFNKLSASLANVRPVVETAYKYADGNFLPVKRTSYTYQTVPLDGFAGYKAVKVATMGNTTGCNYCTLLPTPDMTQAVDGVFDIYGFTDVYSLEGTYVLPKSTTEELFNDAGTASLSSATTYYYDNPDHQMPTRIVTKNSKGEELTTQMKYPLDYNFNNCGSAGALYSNYLNGNRAIKDAYSSCYYSLVTSLDPYQPYSSHHQDFQYAASQYDCKGAMLGATAALIANRNAAEVSYLGCLDAGAAGTGPAWQRSVQWMKRNNVISPVIEKYISVKKADNNEYLLAATRNDYDLFDAGYGNKSALPVTVKQVEADGTLSKTDFLAAPDNYYKPQLAFRYDAALNLSGQQKTNDIAQTYIWGYGNQYPIAAVSNATEASVAYTSFESEEMGNWTGVDATGIVAVLPHPPTGKRYLQGSFDLTKTHLPAGTYTVSYWSNGSSYHVGNTSAVAGRQQDGWTYYEHSVPVPADGSVEITGTGAIDELRLYPKGAQMTTFAYTPLVGMTAQCDAASHISYFEYDGMGRLLLVRDQNRHILKSYAYQYAGY